MISEPSLQDAIGRLHDFRHAWKPGDIIDEESQLTTDDLDEILAFLSEFPASD